MKQNILEQFKNYLILNLGEVGVLRLIDDLQKILHLDAITDVKPYLDQPQCIP